MEFKIRIVKGKDLPKKLEALRKGIPGMAQIVINKIATKTQLYMRAYAPSASGELRNEIRVVPVGKTMVQITIPNIPGAVINYGSKPRWIHKDMQSVWGYTVEDWMMMKGIPVKNYIHVSGQAYPFIEPAIESVKFDIPNIIQTEVEKVIIQSGFGR